MHSLEYALVILGSKIENELDQEIGRRIIELASYASRYQPPKDTDGYSGGPPDENYLREHIRIHDPNCSNLK